MTLVSSAPLGPDTSFTRIFEIVLHSIVTSVSRAILGIRILYHRIVTLVSGALLGILFLGVFR